MEKLNNDEIKRKLSKTTVHMDIDAEWNEIESLLDQEETKKKRIFWIPIFAVLGALVFFGLSFFNDDVNILPYRNSKEEAREINSNTDEIEAQLTLDEIENKALSNTVQSATAVTEKQAQKLKNQGIAAEIEKEESTKGFREAANHVERSKIANEAQLISAATKNETVKKENQKRLPEKEVAKPATQGNPSTNETASSALIKRSVDKEATAANKSNEKTIGRTEARSDELIEGIDRDVVTQNSNQNKSTADLLILNQGATKGTSASALNSNNKQITIVRPLRLGVKMVQRSIHVDAPLSTTDINIRKPIQQRRQFLFIESNIASVNQKITSSLGNEYASLLKEKYDVLSQVDVGGGFGLFISKKWQLSLGLKYNQYRTVFKAQLIEETETSEIRDSAQVYTNIHGGTFYAPGKVITKTTNISDIQQYSYMHSLGLGLNARYYFLGPLYAGAKISWSPVQWQAGNLVDADDSLKELKELTTQINKLAVDINLGVSVNISEGITLDAGLFYRPRQSLFRAGGVSISSSNIGGNLRLSYRL